MIGRVPKKNKVVGVSFPDETLLVYAKKQAAAERRSFSNFVTGLIEDDRRRRLSCASVDSVAGDIRGRVISRVLGDTPHKQVSK